MGNASQKISQRKQKEDLFANPQVFERYARREAYESPDLKDF